MYFSEFVKAVYTLFFFDSMFAINNSSSAWNPLFSDIVLF